MIDGVLMRCHRDELIWQCYECIKVSRSFVVVVHFFTKRRDIGHDRPLFPVYAKLIIDRKHFLSTTLKRSEVHLFLGKNSPFNQMISFFIFLVALINLKAKSSGKVTDRINIRHCQTSNGLPIIFISISNCIFYQICCNCFFFAFL